MALAITKQLQMKLVLEKRFQREVRSIFSAIAMDFMTSVALNGIPPQARRYLPAWSAALDNHYRRTQKLFTGAIGKQSNKQQLDDDSSEEELLLLLAALLAWRDKATTTHAMQLVSTTERNMLDALQTAQAQFALDNKIPTDRELAVAAAAILRRKFNGRVGPITISETQAAAESTKFIEAEVASGLKPRVLGGGLVATTTTKTWRTVGDRKVRRLHQAANGQLRPITEPFIVGNEFLMFPGDESMGASTANVANCRCIAQYSF